jgi:Fe-S cluster biogenesis protein NfuA
MAANPSTALDPEGRTLERVQELTQALDELADGPEKEIAEELVAAIVDLYGAGLARVVQTLSEAGAAGAEIQRRLIQDGVVASLLLVHDLYPVDLETRVLEALASVRPYMESHGGNVELAGIDEGVARLRLVGHCHGCPASAATLELAIKDALDEHAPDLVGLEVEGVAQPQAAPTTATWVGLEEAGDVATGELKTLTARGVDLIVANVAGTMLAYRSECAACDASLDDATLAAEILTCDRCKHGFVLTEAGRAVGSDDLHLEPVPLLRRTGLELAVALSA